MENKILGNFNIYVNDGNYGNIYPEENEFLDKGVPFISASDFSEKMFDFIGCKHISKELHDDILKKGHVQKNDIIIVVRGNGIGKVGMLKDEIEDCNINAQLAFIRVLNDDIDPDYLYYLLKSEYYFQVIRRYGSGSAQPQLPLNRLMEVPICYFENKTIQRKIGYVLSALDSKIIINNKINAELEAMAKTLYDYWFLQFEFPNEEGKPYKSSGGKMVWNEELKREIPEGWEVTTIGDVTVCHDSKRIPLTGNEREEIKGNIPYYGATGIMGYVNRPIFDGDYVLVAEDGSVMNEKGNPIIQRVSGKIWVNNHAHVLEPIKNYSCKLLMMILKDIPVAAIKTGSIQMKINQENLNKVKILDIPNEIKKQINKQFETIDKMILENNKENQELASLRDFLLPLLMNGQVGFKE